MQLKRLEKLEIKFKLSRQRDNYLCDGIFLRETIIRIHYKHLISIISTNIITNTRITNSNSSTSM